MQYCNKFTPKNCVNNSAHRALEILKFNKTFPADIEYSLLVFDSFQVDTYCWHAKLATRDLINRFTNTLTQLSQVNFILDRLENTESKFSLNLVFMVTRF